MCSMDSQQALSKEMCRGGGFWPNHLQFLLWNQHNQSHQSHNQTPSFFMKSLCDICALPPPDIQPLLQACPMKVLENRKVASFIHVLTSLQTISEPKTTCRPSKKLSPMTTTLVPPVVQPSFGQIALIHGTRRENKNNLVKNSYMHNSQGP